MTSLLAPPTTTAADTPFAARMQIVQPLSVSDMSDPAAISPESATVPGHGSLAAVAVRGEPGTPVTASLSRTKRFPRRPGAAVEELTGSGTAWLGADGQLPLLRVPGRLVDGADGAGDVYGSVTIRVAYQ